MPGTAAKVNISERQQKLLDEFRKSRTIGQCLVQRATIVLLSFSGMLNQDIALQVGLNRQQVGLWRQRWRDAWDALCVWECTEPHRLREAIVDVLSDAPRPGAPATFTAEQVSQIVALACEPPKLSGRPIDHWTLRELRDEAIKRTIVTDISASRIGYFLQQAAVQPHRKKMWLNTTEKDPKKFQAHLHIKDWKKGGHAAGHEHGVLAGCGDGQVVHSIRDAVKRGYRGFAVMEPHLRGGSSTGGHTGPDLFPPAVEAFRAILKECGGQEA